MTLVDALKATVAAEQAKPKKGLVPYAGKEPVKGKGKGKKAAKAAAVDAAATLAHCDALLDVSGKQQAAEEADASKPVTAPEIASADFDQVHQNLDAASDKRIDKIVDDLAIPAALDRTAGKTTEEIKMELKKLSEASAREATGKRLLSPSEAMAKAKAGKGGKAAKGKAASGKSAGKPKGEVIANLLKRKDGCTTADILKATGWKAVNVPRAAKDAGLKCKKVKTAGEPTRYFGS